MKINKLKTIDKRCVFNKINPCKYKRNENDDINKIITIIKISNNNNKKQWFLCNFTFKVNIKV